MRSIFELLDILKHGNKEEYSIGWPSIVMYFDESEQMNIMLRFVVNGKCKSMEMTVVTNTKDDDYMISDERFDALLDHVKFEEEEERR